MVVGVLEPHVILIYWPLFQLLQSPLSQPLSFHTKDLIIFKLPGHLNWSFNQELLSKSFSLSSPIQPKVTSQSTLLILLILQIFTIAIWSTKVLPSISTLFYVTIK